MSLSFFSLGLSFGFCEESTGRAGSSFGIKPPFGLRLAGRSGNQTSVVLLEKNGGTKKCGGGKTSNPDSICVPTPYRPPPFSTRKEF